MDPFYLDFCNTTKEFKKLLTKYFSPEIRKLGFKGTGLNYNKQDGHYIYSIQIFPDKWGGKCWIEAGVHLDFIPESSHLKIPKPSRVKAIDSMIRKTIETKGKQNIYLYGRNEEEAKSTIIDMLKDIKKIGIPYINQFTDFPNPFDKVSAKDLINDTYPWLEDIAVNSLNLARINCFLDKKKKTDEFCKFGLKPTTERGGKMIRALFVRLLNGDKNFCFTKEELTSIKQDHEKKSAKRRKAARN